MSSSSPLSLDDLAGRDSHFNTTDSFAEFIVETVLHYDNAIPESKTRHHKELQQHKHFQVVFQKIEPISAKAGQSQLTEEFGELIPTDKNQFIKEIQPPPPKA
jgi:hypothetical protein